jgi:predicted nucleotidyltransferase
MARDWEEWFRNSVGPSSDTESESRDRTEKSIRDAIAASDLAGRVRVFTKGSYATNTNVRRDSDVDVVVEWNEWVYYDKVNEANALSWPELGVTLTASDVQPADYRRWVTEALQSYFGAARVDASGSKAMTVAGGSTTLDADVVPCFKFKRWFSPHHTEDGTRLYPTSGPFITGWPEQQRVNGNRKNTATSKRYKQVIRALKRLENDMVATGRLPDPIAGYFIECLLSNVEDARFTSHGGLTDTVKLVLATLIEDIEQSNHHEWAEVNGLKWLWRDGQSWTSAQAQDFALNACVFIVEK